MNPKAANFVIIYIEDNRRCSFIVDSGADISIIELNRVPPQQIVNKNKRFQIKCITQGIQEPLAETIATLHFENEITLCHNF